MTMAAQRISERGLRQRIDDLKACYSTEPTKGSAPAPEIVNIPEQAIANIDEFERLYEEINTIVVLIAATAVMSSATSNRLSGPAEKLFGVDGVKEAQRLYGTDWAVAAGTILQVLPDKLDRMFARISRVRDFLEAYEQLR